MTDRPAVDFFGWILSDDEEEPPKTQLVVYDPILAKTATAAAAAEATAASALSAEFKAQRERKCMKWIRSSPQDRLLVAWITIWLAVSTLRVVEKVASESWQTTVWRDCTKVRSTFLECLWRRTGSSRVLLHLEFAG